MKYNAIRGCDANLLFLPRNCFISISAGQRSLSLSLISYHSARPALFPMRFPQLPTTVCLFDRTFSSLSHMSLWGMINVQIKVVITKGNKDFSYFLCFESWNLLFPEFLEIKWSLVTSIYLTPVHNPFLSLSFSLFTPQLTRFAHRHVMINYISKSILKDSAYSVLHWGLLSIWTLSIVRYCAWITGSNEWNQFS